MPLRPPPLALAATALTVALTAFTAPAAQAAPAPSPAAALSTALSTARATTPVPVPDQGPAAAASQNWPYSVLPGFDPLRASADRVPLVSAPRPLNVTYTVDGKTHTLDDYLLRTAQGFVALDGDKIVKEWYGWGFGRDSLFQSWSMAKSFTGNLIGIAMSEGRIGSLEDTVGEYVPELDDTAYGDVTLRNLLRMSSGIAWNEVPDDVPLHLIASLGALSTRDMAAAARKAGEQGSGFNYSSLNSAVLALVLQEATGKPYYKYLQEKIWGPAGMAADAYVGNDSHGNGMGYCCVYATVRDFARFGKMMLDGGAVAGRQVVPKDWVAAATSPSGVSGGYGLQWWIDPGEGFYASGAFDQKIYVSTRYNVVVVRTTGLNPDQSETMTVMRAVAAEVARTRGTSSGSAASR